MEQQVPPKIELKVGEKYTLRLKGMAGAGYTWKHAVEETGKVVTVSMKTAEYPQHAGKFPPPGHSLDELVTIQALEPGHATIRFVLRRSWKKDIPPLREHILEVNVKS